MKEFLTEIKKEGKLYIGESIRANSFVEAESIALTRKKLTRVLGIWLFTLTNITKAEADFIINQHNRKIF